MISPKNFLLICFLAFEIFSPAMAQSVAGNHILNALRAASSEEVRLKKIPDGNYVVFTPKNCLACFKQLQDSLKAITGKSSYNIVLLMKEEPLKIQGYISLLARSGVKPQSYYVHYYDLDTNAQLQKMRDEEPSPWLLQKRKSQLQLQTYSDLKPLLEK